MIIETPYKIGDTVSLKLTSGEELIGRLDEEKPSSLVLKRPLMLTATAQGLGLAPFMFTIGQDPKVNINMNTVVCVHKTEESMAKQYITSTTGIQTL